MTEDFRDTNQQNHIHIGTFEDFVGIMFPICRLPKEFPIKNRELRLSEVRGSGLPITTKQESSRLLVSISPFF